MALNDQEGTQLVLHGLNAVYLKSINQWIRLDARGNKEGINAQFSIETEKLAFNIRLEYGEVDDSLIYATPSENVIRVLKSSNSFTELIDKLPSDI